MQKLLVPILVLTAVALSSSNVVPVMTMHQLNAVPIGYNYQENDNTFSSKHHNRNKQNAILFNVDVEPEIDKISANYVDNSDDFSMNNDDNYDVKGFRKEQWHNNPRQLDRLNRYLYQHQSTDKRNLDPDEPESDSVASNYRNQEVFDDTLNDYDPENEPDTRTTNHEAEMAAAVINPLLIFRIHLACYNNNKAAKPTRLETDDLDNERLQNFNNNENSFSNEVNPGPNQIKVKREDKINSEGNDIERKYQPSNITTYCLIWIRRSFIK